MAGMQKEQDRVGVPITTTREPKGPMRGGDKGSPGDQAFMDAVFVTAGAWLLLAFLVYTLRSN